MKLLSLTLLFLLAATVCQGRPSESVSRIIQLLTSTDLLVDGEVDADILEKERVAINYHNCRSWHLGVETNNIRDFKTVPANCQSYVEDYLSSPQYRADSKTVCKEAYFYAKGLDLKNDTINAWVFDLDETLLSNVPFYSQYGYGTQEPDQEAFRKWIEKGEVPVLPESLHLYYNLVNEVGLKPILLTERYEELKEVTLKNLQAAGFTYWERVIFKPNGSNAKPVNFKAQARKQLRKSGYNIIGNIGDQWGDLLKDSPGRRTFKLPNPLYYKY